MSEETENIHLMDVEDIEVLGERVLIEMRLIEKPSNIKLLRNEDPEYRFTILKVGDGCPKDKIKAGDLICPGIHTQWQRIHHIHHKTVNQVIIYYEDINAIIK